MTKKEKNAELRKNKWRKRICLTEESHEYIQEQMIKKKYKTMAGTLDMIINEYKKYDNKNIETG